ADICMVTSLHDGMNLVAKEFVAARDDEQGVLLLSTFAGASRELLEALIVNPYDAAMMSGALLQALTMSAEEQRERMRRMREIVRDNNVYRWAGSMLLDAARLRKRGELDRVTANAERSAIADNVVPIFERRQVAGLR
ncbi:trehalose-6-phosphate synthase, partial [Mesorhizobium sp. M4A.F.Ca.ET.022.05.2.1]